MWLPQWRGPWRFSWFAVAVDAVAIVEAGIVALAAAVIKAAAVPFLLVYFLPGVQWAMRALRVLSLPHTLRPPATYTPHMGTWGRPLGCIAIAFPLNLIRG